MGVQVTRVLIERGRAVGVEWMQAGALHSARANAEVILAAGALQSPQLLQLSGVGPAALLQGPNIPVQVDAPEVGRNLQHHYQARVTVKLREKMSLNDQVPSPVGLARTGLQWLLQKRGPLTVGAGQVGGMVCSEHAQAGRPDLLFNGMPLSVDKPGDPLHRFSGFSASASASATQCRPGSRGTVEIRSTDPFEAPRIVSNDLTAPADIKVLVSGLEVLRDIYAQPSLRGLVTGEEHLPGTPLRSDAELEQFARDKGGTVFRPVGTCRMGGDAVSVVDPQLRVRGVERLRAIDASVMPTTVSTNTNAATVMIAEKGAAMVQGAVRRGSYPPM